MRVYTSHVRAGAAPVLVPEGFCWAALGFGFLYLAGCGALVPAALNLAVYLLLLALVGKLGSAPLFGLALLQGIFGRDWRRWNLGLLGYAAGPVVVAPDPDAALLRLLGARPDLIPSPPGSGG